MFSLFPCLAYSLGSERSERFPERSGWAPWGTLSEGVPKGLLVGSLAVLDYCRSTLDASEHHDREHGRILHEV